MASVADFQLEKFTMDELSVHLSQLGLSEAKVSETLKNKKLTKSLNQLSIMASEYGSVSKSSGNLLYILGTKMPSQFHKHFPVLVHYICKGRINQEAKVLAGIKYFQDHESFNKIEFEEECGANINVSQEEIEDVVTMVIKQNLEQIKTERYKYSYGTFATALRKMEGIPSSFRWAENRLIKEEFDLQMVTTLGAKTEKDLKKPTKKKEAKDKSFPQTDQWANKVSNTSNVPHTEKSPMTMKEFLKTIHFHEPGQNFKTDGYTITPKTYDLMKEHLNITNGQVRTRFPPEPNGILHIGHAKAININFGYAAAHDGICFLRYDDTNPEKEEEKFFEGIKDMVEWLGYKPWKITHSSDYFEQLYNWAEQLIKLDLAFVCHQSVEEMRGQNVAASPWRERPKEESMQLFRDMKHGKFAEGEATLRLKLCLEEGKVDPVAYRIKYVPHHRSGDKWCIYPTYDYTHCLCDSIEHITHSLCTKEFQSRRSSYYWLCNSLNVYCPVQWEYGRLNMGYTVVSKRKIAKLIQEGIVADWDDPRLFTLTALRRRGFPSEAINNFCASLGLTGAQISLHPDALESYVRDVLNAKAHRTMVVLEPLRVVIVNFPNDHSGRLSVSNIPGKEETGNHEIAFAPEIWIEQSDFKELGEKDYRRLTPNQNVGLRHAGFVLSVCEVLKTSEGSIESLRVKCEPVSEGNKPKAFVHWVAKPENCKVRLYEKLFLHEHPEDTSVVPGGFLTDINSSSLREITALTDAWLHPQTTPLTCFQFERVGFFCVDHDSLKEGCVVFNRTVNLKEDKGKV